MIININKLTFNIKYDDNGVSIYCDDNSIMSVEDFTNVLKVWGLNGNTWFNNRGMDSCYSYSFHRLKITGVDEV
jgi:hypothetical protein